ncbi:hypothetical protein BGZ47_006362 [Haplosporangium gracile]|nr:hypothetical protein BGZ47_006362 [Haplosporangium gracile]
MERLLKASTQDYSEAQYMVRRYKAGNCVEKNVQMATQNGHTKAPLSIVELTRKLDVQKSKPTAVADPQKRTYALQECAQAFHLNNTNDESRDRVQAFRITKPPCSCSSSSSSSTTTTASSSSSSFSISSTAAASTTITTDNIPHSDASDKTSNSKTNNNNNNTSNSDANDEIHIVCHKDPITRLDVVLWSDILTSFKNAVGVRNGTMSVPFLKGADLKNLEPIRIPAVLDAVLDIVMEEQLDDDDKAIAEIDKAVAKFNVSTRAQLEDTGGRDDNSAQVIVDETTGEEVEVVVTEAQEVKPEIEEAKRKDVESERDKEAIDLDKGAIVLDKEVLDLDEEEEEVKRNGEAGAEDEGVDQDYTADSERELKAAERGDLEAQYNVGFIYQHGYGISQDLTKAKEWYLRAALREHREAQLEIGQFYEIGQGGCPKDFTKAKEWYLKAIALGHGLTEAQFRIGYLYEVGHGSVIRDYQTAMGWYFKAADRKNAEARFRIGCLYEGGHGVAQDYRRAMEWYIKAAGQDYAAAQYKAGLLYYTGLGFHGISTRRWSISFRQPIKDMHKLSTTLA